MRTKPQLLRVDCLDKKTDAWLGSGQKKKSARTLRVQEYRRGVGGDAVARVVRHALEPRGGEVSSLLDMSLVLTIGFVQF